MLTSKQFTARCATIGRAEDALRELVADCLAFALFHAVVHGNKKPMTQLCESAPTGWLRDQLDKVAVGRRDKSLTESQAVARAGTIVAAMFASRKETLAIQKANREARAEAKAASESAQATTPATEPAAPAVGGSGATTAPFSLTVKGELFELDAEEAEMALQYILAARIAAAPIRLAA